MSASDSITDPPLLKPTLKKEQSPNVGKFCFLFHTGTFLSAFLRYRKLRNYREIKNSTNANSHMCTPQKHTWKTHLFCVTQLMGVGTINKNGLLNNSDTKIYLWFLQNVGNVTWPHRLNNGKNIWAFRRTLFLATDFL